MNTTNQHLPYGGMSHKAFRQLAHKRRPIGLQRRFAHSRLRHLRENVENASAQAAVALHNI
jgi:hypothetical protein